jgi:hypothetical protein
MEWAMKILTEVCMVVNRISMMMDRKLMRILMKMIIMMKRRRTKWMRMKMVLIAPQKRRLEEEKIRNN